MVSGCRREGAATEYRLARGAFHLLSGLPELVGREEFVSLVLKLVVDGSVCCTLPGGFGGPCGGSTLSKKATLSGEEVGVEICDERAKLGGDADCWEEEAKRRVDSPGWAVCRVASARNIARVIGAAGGFRELMESLENFVGRLVAAASLPPAFDDAPVVPINFVVKARRRGWDESSDEEFEADRFRPANVSAVCVPVR